MSDQTGDEFDLDALEQAVAEMGLDAPGDANAAAPAPPAAPAPDATLDELIGAATEAAAAPAPAPTPAPAPESAAAPPPPAPESAAAPAPPAPEPSATPAPPIAVSSTPPSDAAPIDPYNYTASGGKVTEVEAGAEAPKKKKFLGLF